MPQSRNIGENSDRGICNFWISGQSLIERNWHNFRTIDDIDMKIGPVSKTDKRNNVKTIDLEIMLEHFHVISIFPVYGQVGAIWKPESGCIVCKTYVVINSNFLFYKNLKQSLKIFNTALALLLWVKILFWPKLTD